jgi:hypothetical protein
MDNISKLIYSHFQASNPEQDFNEDLLKWREQDDAAGYLEDVFLALSVVPGITFNGITIERDESRFPAGLTFNDIEPSRLDLARVHINLKMGDEEKDIVLNIFLPKLIDGLFYILNGSTYYPILQLVDRGTYATRRTLTLKTLLMPLMFRRDTLTPVSDVGTPGSEPSVEQIFTLDLFRSKINVMKYMMASKGLAGAVEFLGGSGGEDGDGIGVALRDEVSRAVAEDGPGVWRAHEVKGPAGLVVVAKASWVEAEAPYRASLLATVAGALEGVPRRAVEEDDPTFWRRHLGRHFTQNSNGFEEKASKILVSLERILDRRTKQNLAHVAESDKEDVYCVLRWMMREFRQLSMVDGMDLRNKRIRVSEYLINPLLMRFSESTYRLLNSKNLTFRSLLGIFKTFISEDGSSPSQANFLVGKLVTNELLRYAGRVNSNDFFLALRWTYRGPQSMGDRGKGDIALRYRGLHPSYVGRISLSSASASDPGMGGTMVPFCNTDGQFIV